MRSCWSGRERYYSGSGVGGGEGRLGIRVWRGGGGGGGSGVGGGGGGAGGVGGGREGEGSGLGGGRGTARDQGLAGRSPGSPPKTLRLRLRLSVLGGDPDTRPTNPLGPLPPWFRA